MTETFPHLPANVRVLSVVICACGYQARIEESYPIAFHPHTRTLTRVAQGETICSAIKAALTGKQLRMIS